MEAMRRRGGRSGSSVAPSSFMHVLRILIAAGTVLGAGIAAVALPAPQCVDGFGAASPNALRIDAPVLQLPGEGHVDGEGDLPGVDGVTVAAVSKLSPCDGGIADMFGSEVATAGSIIAGAARFGGRIFTVRGRDEQTGAIEWSHACTVTTSIGPSTDFGAVAVEHLFSGGGADVDGGGEVVAFGASRRGEVLVLSRPPQPRASGQGGDDEGCPMFTRSVLLAPPGTGWFGAHLAMAGGIIAVGAPGLADSPGSVVVYEPVEWEHGQPMSYSVAGTLVSEVEAEHASFGVAVAVGDGGDTIVVGASLSPSYSAPGAVRVYKRGANDEGEDSTGWALRTALHGSLTPSGAGDGFGASVAVCSKHSLVVVGAPRADRVHIFQLAGADDGESEAVEVAEITASSLGISATSQFGAHAAVSEEGVVAVGAPWSDPVGTSNAGHTFVFLPDGPSLQSWSRLVIVEAPDASTHAFFGVSVAISRAMLVVGAYQDAGNGPATGAAYSVVLPAALSSVTTAVASSSGELDRIRVHLEPGEEVAAVNDVLGNGFDTSSPLGSQWLGYEVIRQSALATEAGSISVSAHFETVDQFSLDLTELRAAGLLAASKSLQVVGGAHTQLVRPVGSLESTPLIRLQSGESVTLSSLQIGVGESAAWTVPLLQAAGHQSFLSAVGCTFSMPSALGHEQRVASVMSLSADSTGVLNHSTFLGLLTDQNGAAVAVASGAALTARASVFEECTANKGGAIAVDNAEVEVVASSFRRCESTVAGGAIVVAGEAGSLLIEDSTVASCAAPTGGFLKVESGAAATVWTSDIVDNSATGAGGAVLVDSGSATLQGCVATGNAAVHGGVVAAVGGGASATLHAMVATDNAAVSGGVLYVADGATVRLSGHSVLRSNEAEVSGGALWAGGSSEVSVAGAEFVANAARLGDGGAVCVTEFATVDVHGCRFEGNVARTGGGALWLGAVAAGGLQRVESSSLLHNAAGFGGGVSVVAGSRLNVSTTQLSENRAAHRGGALHVVGATVGCTSCSISNNTAGESGGALFMSDAEALVSLTHADVHNNSAAAGGGVACTGAGHLTVANGSIQENSALVGSGGAVAIDRCLLSMSSTAVVGNSAAECGGGVWLSEANLAGGADVALCTFQRNAARRGGAVCHLPVAVALTLEAVDFLPSNTAALGGASVYWTLHEPATDAASRVGWSSDVKELRLAGVPHSMAPGEGVSSLVVSALDAYGNEVIPWAPRGVTVELIAVDGESDGEAAADVAAEVTLGGVSSAALPSLVPMVHPGAVLDVVASGVGLVGAVGSFHVSLCPPGSEPGGVGQRCALCSAGFASLNGTECVACPPESLQPDAGAVTCVAVPAGHIIVGGDATTSSPCPRGSYADSATHCSACPFNTFGPLEGLTTCVPCPAGHVTLFTGAESVEECVAVAESDDGESHDCECDDGEVVESHDGAVAESDDGESDDGGSSDGESSDGESSAVDSDDGEVAESSDGELEYADSDDGAVVESNGEELDNRESDDEAVVESDNGAGVVPDDGESDDGESGGESSDGALVESDDGVGSTSGGHLDGESLYADGESESGDGYGEYYFSGDNGFSASARECPVGIVRVNCSTPTLWVMEAGYWRAHAESQAVVACRSPSMCVGGGGVGNELCALGHAGAACDVCAEGHRRRDIMGQCGAVCGPAARATVATWMLGALGAVVLVFVCFARAWVPPAQPMLVSQSSAASSIVSRPSTSSKGMADSVASLPHQATQSKAAALLPALAAVQVLGYVAATFDAPEASLWQFVLAPAIVVATARESPQRDGCSGLPSAVDDFKFTGFVVGSGLGAALMLWFLTAWCSMRESARAAGRQVFQVAAAAALLPTALAAADALWCRELDVAGAGSVLATDNVTACADAAGAQLAALATLGAVVMLVVVLFRTSRSRLSVLQQPYASSTHPWLVTGAVARVAMLGLLSALSPSGPAAQCFVGVLMSVLLATFEAVWVPVATATGRALVAVCSAAVVMVFTCLSQLHAADAAPVRSLAGAVLNGTAVLVAASVSAVAVWAAIGGCRSSQTVVAPSAAMDKTACVDDAKYTPHKGAAQRMPGTPVAGAAECKVAFNDPRAEHDVHTPERHGRGNGVRGHRRHSAVGGGGGRALHGRARGAGGGDGAVERYAGLDNDASGGSDSVTPSPPEADEPDHVNWDRSWSDLRSPSPTRMATPPHSAGRHTRVIGALATATPASAADSLASASRSIGASSLAAFVRRVIEHRAQQRMVASPSSAASLARRVQSLGSGLPPLLPTMPAGRSLVDSINAAAADPALAQAPTRGVGDSGLPAHGAAPSSLTRARSSGQLPPLARLPGRPIRSGASATPPQSPPFGPRSPGSSGFSTDEDDIATSRRVSEVLRGLAAARRGSAPVLR